MPTTTQEQSSGQCGSLIESPRVHSNFAFKFSLTWKRVWVKKIPLSSALRRLCSWLPSFPWGPAISDFCSSFLPTLSVFRSKFPLNKVLGSAELIEWQRWYLSLSSERRGHWLWHTEPFAWQWEHGKEWIDWSQDLIDVEWLMEISGHVWRKWRRHWLTWAEEDLLCLSPDASLLNLNAVIT